MMPVTKLWLLQSAKRKQWKGMVTQANLEAHIRILWQYYWTQRKDSLGKYVWCQPQKSVADQSRAEHASRTNKFNSYSISITQRNVQGPVARQVHFYFT